jgi:hypothetical protein
VPPHRALQARAWQGYPELPPGAGRRFAPSEDEAKRDLR